MNLFKLGNPNLPAMNGEIWLQEVVKAGGSSDHLGSRHTIFVGLMFNQILWV
jgi:hypothetical protein